MTISDDINAWLNTRPDWYIKLLVDNQNGIEITDEYSRNLFENLDNGSSSTDDFDGAIDTKSENGIVLDSISQLNNINALTDGQQLNFSDTGITLVFGENGSGKSGYARILRHASNARIDNPILGNVFADPSSEQEATITFHTIGTTDEIEVHLDDLPNDLLSKANYYDRECGVDYLTNASEIAYSPPELTSLKELIGCLDALKETIDRQMITHEASCLVDIEKFNDTPIFHYFQNDITNIDSQKYVADINQFSQEYDQGKHALALRELARLQGSDPANERSRISSLKSAISSLITDIEPIDALCVEETLKTVQSLTKDLADANKTLALSAQTTFDDEPIQGIGTPEWKLLWEAARHFSQNHAYKDHEFPVTTEGAHCVLCEQELSISARANFDRFKSFVENTAQNKQLVAQENLRVFMDTIKAACETNSDENMLSTLQESDTELAQKYLQWRTERISTLDRIYNSTEVVDGKEDISFEFTSKTTDITKSLELLNSSLASNDGDTFEQNKSKIESQIAIHDAYKYAKDSRSNLLAYRDYQTKIQLLKSFKKMTDTGPITKKISELTKQYVTTEVSNQFIREVERYNLEKVHFEPKSGSKGTLTHRPELLNPTTASTVGNVLSEGEQTVLSLAGFFTDVVFDDTQSCVIFDDPVTSLDHVHREKVAMRIVELAASRQVIVFTHDISFLVDLGKAAKREGIEIDPKTISKKAEQPGHCDNDHPWGAKDIPDRLNTMTQFISDLEKNETTTSKPDYERKTSEFGGMLSECWEKSMRSEIVFQIVDRATNEVRPLKFEKIFRNINDSDIDEFVAGYGVASKWSRRHDKDSEQNTTIPTVKELNEEFEKFKAFHKRIRAYKN